MRTLFTLFGGLSILGAVLDGALAALLGLLVALGRADSRMSIEALVREHIPALAPVHDAAAHSGLDPALLVLAAPALVYVPVRIVLGLTIGAAAIAAARRTPRS